MALSKALAAASAVLLIGSAVGLAQNRVPGPDQEGISQTRAMHADIIHAIEANTRAQVLIARVASQDARVAAVTLQVVDAERALWDAMKARTDTQTEIRRLSQIQPGTQPQTRAATPQEVSEQRQVLLDRDRQEQTARTRFVMLQKSLDAEQAKRAELGSRLDELERSLASLR